MSEKWGYQLVKGMWKSAKMLEMFHILIWQWIYGYIHIKKQSSSCANQYTLCLYTLCKLYLNLKKEKKIMLLCFKGNEHINLQFLYVSSIEAYWAIRFQYILLNRPCMDFQLASLSSTNTWLSSTFLWSHLSSLHKHK